MAPPTGRAPRANQYLSFANNPSSSQATRRPATSNLESETNPLPPVSGQITYPASAILPQDRGLGFETFTNPPENPAPKPVEKSARRRRKMSAWRRPSDDEWETDDDVSIASDLMPNSASEGEPSPPRKKQKLSKKKGKSNEESTSDEDKYYKPPRIKMTRIPATLADANDGDRMMWAWKLKGKSWSAIQDEYLKLTGKNYGHSTLSVRFHMMKRTFASNGALELPDEYYQKYPDDLWLKDVSNLRQQYVRDCEVMMKADKEIEKQRFEAAARIYKAEGETHTPAAIKKRWADMRDLGRDVHPEERYRPEDKELPNQGGLALDFAETEWGAPKTTERMITEEDLAKAKAMVQRATLVSYPDSD